MHVYIALHLRDDFLANYPHQMGCLYLSTYYLPGEETKAGQGTAYGYTMHFLSSKYVAAPMPRLRNLR